MAAATSSPFGRLADYDRDVQSARDCIAARIPFETLVALQEDVRKRWTSCANCGELSLREMQCCSRCTSVRYCSKACQVSNWHIHRRACNTDTITLGNISNYVNISPGRVTAKVNMPKGRVIVVPLYAQLSEELQPLLTQFAKQYPGVPIEYENSLPHVIKALRDNRDGKLPTWVTREGFPSAVMYSRFSRTPFDQCVLGELEKTYGEPTVRRMFDMIAPCHRHARSIPIEVASTAVSTASIEAAVAAASTSTSNACFYPRVACSMRSTFEPGADNCTFIVVFGARSEADTVAFIVLLHDIREGEELVRFNAVRSTRSP